MRSSLGSVALSTMSGSTVISVMKDDVVVVVVLLALAVMAEDGGMAAAIDGTDDSTMGAVMPHDATSDCG